MVSFAMNPFFSSDTSFDISGTVGGLSLTGLDGLIIPVSNLTENIEVKSLFSIPLLPSVYNLSCILLSYWTANGGTVFISTYNGCLHLWWSYFCDMKKKMTNISQKRDDIHLNGCDNGNGWGKPFQITVTLKHNVMSDSIPNNCVLVLLMFGIPNPFINRHLDNSFMYFMWPLFQ